MKNPNVYWKFRNKLSEIGKTNCALKCGEFRHWIKEAATATAPKETKKQPKWMTREALKAIEHKSRGRKVYGNDSAEYKTATKDAKNKVKKAKEEELTKECDKLNSLPQDLRLFKVMKNLNKKQNTGGWGMNYKNGDVVTDKDKIINFWTEFYFDLYDSQSANKYQRMEDESAFNSCITEAPKLPDITLEETIKAIKSLKMGKVRDWIVFTQNF